MAHLVPETCTRRPRAAPHGRVAPQPLGRAVGGMPPPSSACPPSAYDRVLCGTTTSTFAPVPIVPDSSSGFS